MKIQKQKIRKHFCHHDGTIYSRSRREVYLAESRSMSEIVFLVFDMENIPIQETWSMQMRILNLFQDLEK